MEYNLEYNFWDDRTEGCNDEIFCVYLNDFCYTQIEHPEECADCRVYREFNEYYDKRGE